MSKNNDDFAALVFGGLIGAAMAAPKPEEKQELQEYRNLKQEIALRQQKLGGIPNLTKIIARPEYYNSFIEAYKMYLHGFFRGSSIISSALLESILREKFGDLKFYNLIEEASKQNLISKGEYHFLHGIREERNESAHEILKEVREEDCNIILRLTIRLMERLL